MSFTSMAVCFTLKQRLEWLLGGSRWIWIYVEQKVPKAKMVVAIHTTLDLFLGMHQTSMV